MYAAVQLPDFPLQAALRSEPERWALPVALVDPAATTPRVLLTTPAAAEAGVTLGQTPVQALARCRELQVRHRLLAAETATHEALLQTLLAFSPHVELTRPDLLTLDLRGLSRLDGATPNRLRGWVNEVEKAVAALDLRPRVGVGPTPLLAGHAARWGGTHAVVEDPTLFLAGLPVGALEPSSDAAATLHRWGIRTIGELLALGAQEVTDRLGLEALALLGAASTTANRPLRLAALPERFVETTDLEDPVETLEPVLFRLRRWVDQLSRRLELAGRVTRELRLELRLDSGARRDAALRVPEPTRDPNVLFRMLHTHLESVRTDAPVTGLTLTFEPVRPRQQQFSLFATVLRDPAQFQETLARLSALVGSDRVGSPVRISGHQRDAFALFPPDFESPAPVDTTRAAALQPLPWRRLRPGRPARVTTDPATQRPVALQSALAQGRLSAAHGPWRSAGRWWDAASAWQREDWNVRAGPRVVLRLSQTATGWSLTDLLD